MIYQENVSFDGKTWFRIEWSDIDFRTFDSIENIQECTSIEELEDIVNKVYPNSNFKYTYINKK